jgi:hypothetical protein
MVIRADAGMSVSIGKGTALVRMKARNLSKRIALRIFTSMLLAVQAKLQH